MKTTELVNFLNDTLHIKEISDPGYNGLQVAHSGGEVTTVAFAVDACLETFQKAAEGGAQLLSVHHGLMWDKFGAITGMTYNRIKFLIDNDLALYGVHIPLDAHPEYGHNARMAKLLNLQNVESFDEYRGTPIGFSGHLPEPMTRDEFVKLFEKINRAPVQVLPFGKETVQKVAIISGGGARNSLLAIAEGMDIYITGESDHATYHTIKEGRINVIFAGHYHSEKFGLFALAELLTDEFKLKTFFIDAPTGF